MRTKHPKPKRVSQTLCKVNTAGTSYFDRKTFRTIRKLQQSVNLLIPKLSFSRLVREIVQQFGRYRASELALQALQESAEMYLTQLFTDANRCCLHASRVTLFPKDMNLVRDLRGPLDPGNL